MNEIFILLLIISTLLIIFIVLYFKSLKKIHKLQNCANDVESIYSEVFNKCRAVELLVDSKSGKILEANEAACKFYGYKYDEIKMLNIKDINILSEDEISFQMQKAKSERKDHFHFKHKLKNGDIKEVEVYSGPINYNGKTVLYSIVHDITERIRAKKEVLKKSFELENSLKVMNNMLDGIDAAIHVSDLKTNELLFVNSYLRKKVPNLHIGNKCYDELNKYSNKPCEDCKNQELLNDTNKNAQQVWDYFDDKNKKYFHILDRKIKWYDGRDVKLQIEIDITELKKLETENIKKEKILFQQSKMASMGEMIENIAHQWRQPLSAITAAAGYMKISHDNDNLSKEDFDKSLDDIVHTAKFMSETIDDFRGFFKSENEKVNFKIGDILNKAISIISSKFKNRGIVIVKDIEEIDILGYENDMIQIFLNLLSNVKDVFEESEIEDKFLFINIKQINEKVTIEFKDSAGGIDDKIIDRVFEPYFTTKEGNDGTGIGLYMTEEIITKHFDGTISVRNEDYMYNNKNFKGAIFTIEF